MKGTIAGTVGSTVVSTVGGTNGCPIAWFGSTGRRRRSAVASVTLTALLVLLILPSVAAATGRSSSEPLPVERAATVRPAVSSGPTLTITPSAGLVDNQTVTVLLTGATVGGVYAVVECDQEALTLLSNFQEPEDGCDPRHNAIVGADADGVVTATLQVQAVMTTSLGAGDCRSGGCFVALESVPGNNGGGPFIDPITFAPNACAAPGSCATVPDSWDPAVATDNLYPKDVTPSIATVDRAVSGAGTTTETSTPALVRSPDIRAAEVPHSAVVVPGSPATIDLTPSQAGSLTAAGSVTGPYSAAYPVVSPPVTPVSGDGLLRLALNAPGTSFGPGTPSTVVVDATLTDATTSTVIGTQQFVLFWGGQTFTYAGFTGPVTTGDAYTVRLAVEPAASVGGLSQPIAGDIPTADVVDSQLEVVDPTNPQYLAYAYAPVMFGRTTSALQDVPLLADATATPVSGGTQLSYTIIWSHEDSGTGFLPLLEWGEWGRMTDVENAISFTVPSSPAGAIPTDATYLWGGEPATGFADSQSALQETDEPFLGTWDGTHPVLRDATGNNDFSDQGTSAFRFQLAPVPGPAPGEAREAVMDANPFTYQVMGEDVARWYADGSTDPDSPEPGQAGQYGIVDLTTTGTGVDSVRVAIQLSGGSAWYTNDAGTGAALTGLGHNRTVVKFPVGWQSQTVTGVRVEATPASSTSSLSVSSFQLESLQSDDSVVDVTTPTPQVGAAAFDVPVALSLSSAGGTGQTVRPGAPVDPLVVSVRDAFGAPLAGVPVTFSAPTTPGGGRVAFASCDCATETVTSSTDGLASSGAARSGGSDGRLDVEAATIDSLAAPVALPVDLAGTPLATGYRLVAADGGVFSYGGATFEGSAGSLALDRPVVGIAGTSDGGGYWLVASDGGVFAYGDARFFGSTGGTHLDAPIVGMAATPDGGGYWLVASDGGVFAYGDARFFGSTGGTHLDAPIVGMAATSNGHGYWLVASDGGVFSYGNATFDGSTGGDVLNAPIVGIAATSVGNGYWLVAADGGVFAYGSAGFAGSAGSLALRKPITGIATTPDGDGYWLVASDGGVFAYGAAAFAGSAGSLTLQKPVVGMAA